MRLDKKSFLSLLLVAAPLVFVLSGEAFAQAEAAKKKSKKSCGDAQVEIVELAEGTFLPSGELTSKKLVVLQSEEAFTEVTAQYGVEIDAEVDFTDTRVVLADMGPKNSGGYDIEVVGAKDHGDYVSVSVVNIAPGPDCFVTLAITNPFELVSVATTKPIIFNETYEVRNCR